MYWLNQAPIKFLKFSNVNLNSRKIFLITNVSCWCSSENCSMTSVVKAIIHYYQNTN